MTDRPRSDALDHIARAVAAIGSDAFAPALAELCQRVLGQDSLFISVFSGTLPPRQLYSNLDAEATERTIGPYLSYAYLLDPFFELFRQGVGTCVVSLDECAPDDFRSSEYYRVFYSEIGLRNEVTFFVDAGHGASIVLSLGQRRGNAGAGLPPKADLEGYLPLIAALCLKHWPHAAATEGDADSAVTLAFERFQTSKLSTREAAIVRLMLKGHSTKSMARLLGNSPETVKVHRKRIYAKLQISSQGELFSMFLGALAGAHPEAERPPLPPAAPPPGDGARRFLN
ncbi:MAG: LuxR C-terminal-related transcriptional regulator [Paracoccaceae bacterium]